MKEKGVFGGDGVGVAMISAIVVMNDDGSSVIMYSRSYRSGERGRSDRRSDLCTVLMYIVLGDLVGDLSNGLI